MQTTGLMLFADHTLAQVLSIGWASLYPACVKFGCIRAVLVSDRRSPCVSADLAVVSEQLQFLKFSKFRLLESCFDTSFLRWMANLRMRTSTGLAAFTNSRVVRKLCLHKLQTKNWWCWNLSIKHTYNENYTEGVHKVQQNLVVMQRNSIIIDIASSSLYSTASFAMHCSTVHLQNAKYTLQLKMGRWLSQWQARVRELLSALNALQNWLQWYKDLDQLLINGR